MTLDPLIRRCLLLAILSVAAIGMSGCIPPQSAADKKAQERADAPIGRVPADTFRVSDAHYAVGAYSRTKFQLGVTQLNHNFNIYKNSLVPGQAPTSHDEYVEKFMEPYNLSFPKLPEGYSFVYEVETETLMVEGPMYDQ